ncbi:MAG: ABC transporter substrate-binding protein [Chloroflexota bacterium]|nr:ABC transporter substrate-binding protein [Chloroflexota bacterium]
MRQSVAWRAGWWMPILLGALMLAPLAGAQDASPAASPVTDGEVITSISRDDYYAALDAEYAFEEAASEGGQLILADTTDIDTVNALLSDDIPTAYIVGLMFESLVGVSPIDGSIVPGLADSYEIGADGLTYTFNINPDANWHDGMPVTAEDVVVSLDFATSGESVYAYTTQMVESIASYQAIDEKTVEIVATDLLATFLYDVPGTLAVMPAHIWGEVPFSEWQNDPGSTGQDPSRVVGSGPFTFVEWVQGESATLAKNDAYWNPREVPNVDEFIFRVLPDENTAVQALTTGEVDILEGIPPAQVADVQNSGVAEVEIYDTLRFNWYSPNQLMPIFTDVAVRQALLYALDRQLIADEIYLGFAEQANGTQPVLSPAYAPEEINTVYNYDPALASQLLADAGWDDVDGDGVLEKDLNGDGEIGEDEVLTFEFIYSEGVAIYEQMVPYIQESWAAIGVAMVPQAMPFPTLQQRADDGDFGIALYGFSWSPDAGQGIMFRCDSFAPQGFNSMRYCNEEYDALDDMQQRELDPEARVDLLIELSNIVNDDAANGILVFRQEMSGATGRVHNFFPSGFTFPWSIPYIWVEE